MRSEFTPVKNALKELVKEAIWFSMTRFEQGEKKSIFVFTSRRSGGTLLTEVIAAGRGIRSIAQPTSIYTASSWQIRYLPIVEMGELISLDGEAEQRLRAYFAKILAGTLQVNAPWKFWEKDFSFTSQRLVLKVGSGKALIDWIDQEYPVHIVYSTRHPIPMALSVIRNGWGSTAHAYLDNKAFVAKYLGRKTLSGCRDVLENGSLLEKHVLNWGLENLAPARLIPQRPDWLFVSYEELTLFPEATVERLAGALDLTDAAKMLKKTRTPSQTSGFSTRRTRELIRKGAGRSLVSGWRTEVTKDEERRCLELLEPLGVSLYAFGEDLPVLARAHPHEP